MDQIVEIRRKLKQCQLGKLDSRHQIKKTQLMLSSRKLSIKRGRMLQRSLRYHKRSYARHEQDKRDLFKSLSRLEKDFFIKFDKATR